GDIHAVGGLGVRRAVPGEDARSETGAHTGKGLADATEADDADCGTGEWLAEQELRPPRFPFSGADVVDALRDAAGGGEHERERQLGGRLGEDVRRVADGGAARGLLGRTSW